VIRQLLRLLSQSLQLNLIQSLKKLRLLDQLLKLE